MWHKKGGVYGLEKLRSGVKRNEVILTFSLSYFSLYFLIKCYILIYHLKGLYDIR